MSVLEWVYVGFVAVTVTALVLSDRWGNFVGTHNWRVSRRLDQRSKDMARRYAEREAAASTEEDQSR